MPVIELLAPAKNKDTAIAAINFGADAVYMGGPAFGARAQAGNSLADIEAVVRHAHIYAAKAYVTLNTILHDAELEQARALMRSIYEAGADAVIVQDMALLSDDLPPIAIHASTQMHNHTVEKVSFLAQTGVKRVVLPREFSLAEIAAVHKAVPQIELEAFIHGALCVSYSGQCYLSHALGGRSANRGECAQPCRNLYSLTDENGHMLAQNKYLLSLKDLCLKDYLADLMDAGAVSFKIEGRLKNAAYVKNAVAFYRRAIDSLLEARPGWHKASAGTVYFDFEPDLNKTFNRRFTPYFINGRLKDITQFDTPKALGEELGSVVKSGKGLVKLQNIQELSPGDGLCWLETEGLKGAGVNKVAPQGAELQDIDFIEPDTIIYRSHNHKFNKLLENSKTKRKLAFDLAVCWEGRELLLDAVDENGLATKLGLLENFEPAQNQEQARAGFIKAFGKLGDTCFELRDFTFKSDLPFLPLGRLNALRRELVAVLTKTRLETFKPKPAALHLGIARFPVQELDFTYNVINKNAANFYAGHGAQIDEPGAESGLNLKGKMVMTTKHCLRYSFGRCLGQNREKPESWILTDAKGRRYKLNFNCAQCCMEIVLL